MPDQQPTDAELSEVSPFTKRRREELARDLLDEMEERGVRLLRELVPHPTQLKLSSTHRHSRGRNHARSNTLVHDFKLLLDIAISDEDAVEKLLTYRAAQDAAVTLILDRVVGLGEEPDLQQSLDLDAREGAEADVATVEALADQKLTAEEARRIEKEERDEIAASRALIRALHTLRTSGQLPGGEAA